MLNFNVAIYIRLSKEDGDKEESYSVSNQKMLLKKYVSERDELTYTDIYIDDGFTGTNFNRPSFIKMIKDIEKGKINCVIVKDLSRFGRDYIETGRYLERVFPAYGVRFISIGDNIDSLKSSYDMLLPIKNIFNEQYSRDISKKINLAFRTKQSEGLFIGSFPSYGYMKNPKNHNQLIIDPYAGKIVQWIFQSFADGKTMYQIAKELNKRNVLSPMSYRYEKYPESFPDSEIKAKYKPWLYNAISRILKKEIYRGTLVQNVRHRTFRGKLKVRPEEEWVVVKNNHPAIISEELWNKVQRNLKNYQSASVSKIDEEIEPNIFVGILKCGSCGSSLSCRRKRRRYGSIKYVYRCSKYVRYGNCACSSHSIPRWIINNILLDDLNRIIFRIGDLRSIILERSQKNNKSHSFEVEIKKSLEKISSLKLRKKRLYDDYCENLLSLEEFKEYKKEIETSISFLETQQDDFKAKAELLSPEKIFEKQWVKRLLEFKKIDSLTREIVLEFVDKIIVHENHSIEIFYNFSNDLNILFPERV